ncbi:MAG: hypothetical protein M0R46_15530 [Candidatus Muirbacterium halophilum]|nr:hypothetical protein [Candidatus Muirbacterium halophilum]MCK9477327.1 hypothetical protein [Candidatus Muirbacterium halophilum]
MKIFSEKYIINHNPFIQKIETIQELNNEIEYTNSIILKKRKNQYLIPYEYGNGIKGKGEYVLRWGIGCIYDCVYCYSKLKVKDSNITVFPDLYNIENEIIKLAKINKNLLINAGENFDSFILENTIPFSQELTHIIAKHKNVKCEFRTKAIVPDSFINNASKENITIAFSLSPAQWRKKIEKQTPPLDKIINNIIKLQKADFDIALRFEPIILFENWQQKYKELIIELSRKINLNKINSIDISLLRLTKQGYKKVSKYNEIIDGELLYHKEDSKYRYFLPYRIKAYRFLINELKKVYTGKIHIGTEPEKFIKKYFKNSENKFIF